MAINPILVVDDEPIVHESIRDWLRDAGYNVITAETGEEALDLVANTDFSIAILDVRLPGKTGIKVLQEIKAKKPATKSIIITAYPTPEIAFTAKQLGAIDYLVKPIAPDTLEKLIKETLSKI